MIWLSALLVFGTVALVAANMEGQGPALRLGYEQMIHARVPWVLLLLLWTGCAFGIAALFRRWAAWKFAVLAVEGVLTALLTWYFLFFSFLPPHELAVQVGDPFPGYALVDQDLARHEVATSSVRPPALYIFYRGDW